MSTLEQLLNILSTTPETKGKRFERYCKWFLENDPRYATQLKKVWLWEDWPDNWGRDKGIDLIAEAYNGNIWAIQAKAYGENNYITKEDVDTFLSESSRKIISFRLLIATTNNIGPNAKEVLSAQEKQVSLCLRDNLESSDLDWTQALTNTNIRIKNSPKEPKPHQDVAIAAVLEGFKASPKGQLYMACGTGKTLVGLWIAKQLNSQNTLVLVPSISLVAQLYREWIENCGEFIFDPIFVCSDKTVSKDEDDEQEYIDYAELGFPVTTTAEEIIKEYSTKDRPKVIFSTYHSSPVIAQACSVNPSLNFDLVIADEAHRCAGKANSAFATITDKDAIGAQRRLYMTATPKIFSEHVKQKTQELECEIVSMDDEEKFGPVFHKLLFSDAIKQDLLSDYQVIISVLDDGTYREYAEKGRFVTFENYETDARTLASQLLTAKSIKKFDLKKVISFHNRTKSATNFIQTFSKALSLLPEDEKPTITYQETIFGDMPQSDRRKILKQFALCKEAALIANVKCLGEGVDIAALDGVIFVDPKGSEIDIIQAVGRAIRKSPNKKIGTIIIPVFVDIASHDETIDLEESCFKPIWQVVRALRSHDDMLAEELDNIRLELGPRTYKNPPKIGKISFDVPVRISSQFAETLKTKLVENIIQKCSSNWNYQFEMLKKYRMQNSYKWPSQGEEFPEGNKLGVWYRAQQHRYKTGLLNQTQIKMLEEIGFIGDVFNSRWNNQYNYLMAYRALYAHKWPSAEERFPEKNRLGAWCNDQRENYKKDLLKEARIKLLSDLGFPWNPLVDDWTNQFVHLKEFRLQNPMRWPGINEEFPSGNDLGGWCSVQRGAYKYKKLSAEKINLLNSISFVWNAFDEQWNRQFEYLKGFRQQNPARWPRKGDEFPEGNNIAEWCVEQRQKFKKGKLSDDKIIKLEVLGFYFDTIDKSWDEQWDKKFKLLCEYRNIYISRWPKNEEEFPKGIKLGSWCSDQRKKFKNNKLILYKKEKLDKISFPWTIKNNLKANPNA